jgi:GAF domain-containing protein
MVGAACEHRQPRVAADVRGEQVRFDNPHLPATRAEIAVPLVVGDHLLGALDVQSEKADAFSEEIISALQLVAIQVAVGLENAQLFARTQANLDELRQIHEVTTGRAWRQFLAAQPGRGHYQMGGAAVEREAWTALFGQARKSGDLVAANLTDGQTEWQAMAIPVKYRGVPIGVLGIHRPADAGPWQAEELAFGESLADRMALALENTRLLEEAQQRASRERLIGDVSGRIRETLDVETVMKTSADEIYEALGLEEVVIRLVAEGGDGRVA